MEVEAEHTPQEPKYPVLTRVAAITPTAMAPATCDKAERRRQLGGSLPACNYPAPVEDRVLLPEDDSYKSTPKEDNHEN